jgi:hypothetical protein
MQFKAAATTEFAVNMVGPSWSRRRKEATNCESRKLSSCFSCSSIDTRSSLEFDVEGARTVLGIVQFHTLSDCANVRVHRRQTYRHRTYVQVQVPGYRYRYPFSVQN